MPYIIKDKLLFIAEASKVLSSSLDYHVTLSILGKILVENVSDFCLIDIFENGDLKRLVVKVSDPKKQKMADAFYKFIPDPDNKQAIYDAARLGGPFAVEHVTKDWLKTVSKIKSERDLVKNLGLKSFIFAPMRSRGRIIGVLTLGLWNDKKFYGKEELIFVQDLADRAGITVDKAMLFSEAQNAVRERDEFLAVASHELKTPLTVILLNLQTMLKKLRSATAKKVNEEELIRLAEISVSQSNRMTKLINDLLNISVITSGRLSVDRENVNLKQITKDVVERTEIQLKKAGIKVTIKAPSDVVGYWDGVRLEQVISNLLSNSVKYGRGKPIEIKISRKNKRAYLRMKDRGIGIPKKFQTTVFENYKRVSQDKGIKGLGIGLFISRQIIESHGGKLYVEKSSSQGTTFTMELPL